MTTPQTDTDTALVEVRTDYFASVIETQAAPSVLLDITGGSTLNRLSHTHTQTEPATVWQITHELGYDPGGICVVSTDGFQLDGFSVQYLRTGVDLRLTFDIGVSGVAYLS